MKKLVVFASLVYVFSFSSVFADPQTPFVDWRQHNQAKRIGQGVRSGELTGRETRRLVRDQGRTRRMERRFKSDGVVTRRERARLNYRAERSSRKIYRYKHNDRVRRWRR